MIAYDGVGTEEMLLFIMLILMAKGIFDSTFVDTIWKKSAFRHTLDPIYRREGHLIRARTKFTDATKCN